MLRVFLFFVFSSKLIIHRPFEVVFSARQTRLVSLLKAFIIQLHRAYGNVGEYLRFEKGNSRDTVGSFTLFFPSNNFSKKKQKKKSKLS